MKTIDLPDNQAQSPTPDSLPADFDLLPETRRILERRFMEFRPFGKDPDGKPICDMRGMSIRSNVEYLEESVARAQGAEAGQRVVEELVRRLNERIPDRAYHVTAKFLKNPWTSYSNEFTAYLVDFCIELSGDPDFQFKMGREKLISPIIIPFMRPLSVKQIFKIILFFVRLFAEETSYNLDTLEVADGFARMRMTLREPALRQFGPYRRACARIWCNAIKAGVKAIPEKVHGLSQAEIKDLRCIVEGHDYCEWEVRWTEPEPWYPGRRIATGLAHRILQKEIAERKQANEGLVQTLKARHDELHGANVELQQSAIELKHRVGHLTTLHEAGLTFTSTRDREVLIKQALETLIHQLNYDRVMIDFYDPLRQVAHGAHLLGVSPESAAFAEQIEVPVSDPATLEGTVMLQGQPILVDDVSAVLDRIHPLHRELAIMTGTKSFISVPLKVKDRILGALTVERTQTHVLTQDDLELMVTFASQLAIALENAGAYQALEQLTQTLEQRVQERTLELQNANERLRELDELKSVFVSTVSHELRTPMTSIKGYVDNILDGLTGLLTEKQSYYLTRVKYNVERLTRMINDLLDLSRIEAGKVELHLGSVCLRDLANDVVEGVQHMAREKGVALHVRHPDTLPPVRGERDKLHQILTNLLQNAVKFTPKGGRVEVESLVRDDGFVQISVSDTGCGIPPHELDLVFDRFYRGEAVPTEDRGSGLGLPIAKSLVDLHGGRIWAESTIGQGSRLFFTVPIESSSPTRP
ncbi:MAG: GAF domain-containing sensor histidine kinase [Dehalococcoidia bacterium]|nr:GAF domain-containing sensor histidine kinase [Dehalococcoidia bacterium]